MLLFRCLRFLVEICPPVSEWTKLVPDLAVSEICLQMITKFFRSTVTTTLKHYRKNPTQAPRSRPGLEKVVATVDGPDAHIRYGEEHETQTIGSWA